MSKSLPRSTTNDPRFIVGIYNYCDRWCERCPLSSRCRVFAKIAAEGEPADFEEVLDRMRRDFAQTIAIVQQEADRLGVDLSQGPDSEEASRASAVRETLEKHPLRCAAQDYARTANAWLAKHADGHGDYDRPAPARDSRLLDGAAALLSRAEAITIIGRYHFQISIKLMRALSFEPLDDDDANSVQNDANGSTRVALLGIERSLDAWFQLLHFNDDADEIMRMLEHLNSLREGLDLAFPMARQFVRPGFDTGDVPWPSVQ